MPEGPEGSPARQLFDEAIAAMDMEKLDRVSLGKNILTWLDSIFVSDGKPMAYQIVVVYHPWGDEWGAVCLNYFPNGQIDAVYDTTVEPIVMAVGGPETNKYADTVAKEILGFTFDDRFLQDD